MATVVIQYNNNLSELVVPSEVSEILNSTVGTGQFEAPVFVSSQYDSATRSVTLTVNFTNTFAYNLTLRSISGNVQCSLHNQTLGLLSLESAIEIPSGETTQFPVLCALTDFAVSHFQAEHPGATSVDVKVLDLTVNINDVTVELSESVDLPNIPIV
jgi:hypothetical protein